MKTVQDYLDLGIEFIKGDVVIGYDNCEYSTDWYKSLQNEAGNCWFDFNIRLFAWRDLTTKPDNAKFSIEVDANNHRWRPSLNQDDNLLIAPPEFKFGDLVVVTYPLTGDKYFITLTYLDDKVFVGYVDERLTGNCSENGNPLMGYLEHVSIEPYNPNLEELKNIIGLHDDPTECAKAILAAGYNK